MLYRRPLKLTLHGYFYLAFLQFSVNAGPTILRLNRLVREVYPEIEPENDGNQSQVCTVGDVVYGVDELVPAEQPCLKCRCQPPGVLCEATRCIKKQGCKVIHKSNQCCPDYQCECEYSGKIYANGERLETQPNEECKVCYCRGGEFQCIDVSCYIRNDCEGKQVPGQCCPKYDHCPPRVLVEKSNVTETESSNNVPRVQLMEVEKQKRAPTIPIEIISKPSTESVNVIDNNPQESKGSDQKITIQEIVPQIKEIPVIPLSVEEKPKKQLIIEETKSDGLLAKDDNINDIVVTDSEAESSEIAEIFHQAPSTLKVEDPTLSTEEGNKNISFLISQDATTDKIENDFQINEPIHDLHTASATHILSLVKRKNKPVIKNNIKMSTETSLDQELSTPLTKDNVHEKEASFRSDVTSTEVNLPLATYYNNVTIVITEQLKNEDTTQSPSTTSVVDNSQKSEIDQNPAYPPIPDVMSANEDVVEELETESNKINVTNFEVHETVAGNDSKILPGILSMRINNTVPENATNPEWLKTDVESNDSMLNSKALLPDDILNATEEIPLQNVTDSELNFAEIGDENTTEPFNYTNEIEMISDGMSNFSDYLKNVSIGLESNMTSDDSRSIESLENSSEDIRVEKTTQKGSHASLTSQENISFEKKDSNSSEVMDMLNESKKENMLKDIVIRTIEQSRKKFEVLNQTSSEVEIIDSKNVEPTKYVSTEMPEKLPKPEKSVVKTIGKRANSPEAEADEVFKQLEYEIAPTEKIQTKQQEEAEAKEVFAELLDEIKSPKSNKPLIPGNSKESEALEKVSHALAHLALGKSRPFDTSVLGVLRDFLGSQHKSYDSETLN